MATLGRPKLEVMVEQALVINPEADIRCFPAGLDGDNVADFLEGADLYVDGLDFFALDAREAVFAGCAKLGVPATTVAPLGMGAALLNFLPGEMTFEEYFGFAGQSELERAPAFLHRACAGTPANGLSRRSLNHRPRRKAWAIDNHGLHAVLRRSGFGGPQNPARPWKGTCCTVVGTFRRLSQQTHPPAPPRRQRPPQAAPCPCAGEEEAWVGMMHGACSVV